MQMGGMGGMTSADNALVDAGEMVYISSLALLKVRLLCAAGIFSCQVFQLLQMRRHPY